MPQIIKLSIIIISSWPFKIPTLTNNYALINASPVHVAPMGNHWEHHPSGSHTTAPFGSATSGGPNTASHQSVWFWHVSITLLSLFLSSHRVSFPLQTLKKRLEWGTQVSEVKRESRNLLQEEENRDVKCWWVLLRFLPSVEGMLQSSQLALHCFVLSFHCTWIWDWDMLFLFRVLSHFSEKSVKLCFFAVVWKTIEFWWCWDLSIYKKLKFLGGGSLVSFGESIFLGGVLCHILSVQLWNLGASLKWVFVEYKIGAVGTPMEEVCWFFLYGHCFVLCNDWSCTVDIFWCVGEMVFN